jgi:hypothetical protein
VDASRRLVLAGGGARAPLWDLAETPLTGVAPPAPEVAA